MKYEEIEGDLVALAKMGKFDVIGHGCNSFSTMGAGIAPQIAKAFGADKFKMELSGKGDINKLGQIDYQINTYTGGTNEFDFFEFDLAVVNCYTQYNYGMNHSDGTDKPLDYEALTLCLRKINKLFRGQHVALPKIGCGLASGDFNRVREIIKTELKDCDVTVVIYNK